MTSLHDQDEASAPSAAACLSVCSSAGALHVLTHPLSISLDAPNGMDESAPLQGSVQHLIAVEHLPVMIYLADPADIGAIQYHSPQIARFLGYRLEEWLADSHFWRTRLHPDDSARIEQSDAQANRTGAPFTIEYRLLAKDGRIVWIRDSGVLVRDTDGQPHFWQGVTADITAQKALEEQLIHQARHDTLTGLPNRAAFTELLTTALARRADGVGNVAVLFLDLDDFKLVNDSLGHQAGDALLIETGQRVRLALRTDDVAARLGGDEFAVLLEHVTESEVVRIAKRLIGALNQPVTVADREVQVSCSVGIAFGSDSAHQPDNLLRWADLAMYRAKAQGKNGYETFEPTLESQALVRLDLGQQLRQAIQEDQFVVYYQPTVALQTGAIIGVEALVRWLHPARGLIEPDEFIAVAEETGLIVPLGAWVLRESCRQVQAWNRGRDPDHPLLVSVNLSAHQLRHTGLVEQIEGVLAETSLPAAQLVLEITERVLIKDVDAAVEVLQALSGLGVRIAIDDFGIGFSSLANLKRFPIHFLKIDQQFVAGLGIDVYDTVVVSGVTDLAHGLELAVIAEGIETAEQLVQLYERGCEYGQGFYFARPLAASELAALLASDNWQGQLLAGITAWLRAGPREQPSVSLEENALTQR